jgi:hypothetical protein
MQRLNNICRIWIAVLVFGSLICSMSLGQAAKPNGGAHKVYKHACTAGADQKCPPAADYEALKTYQEKYTAPPPPPAPQEEQDYINGLWARIAQNPPDGFYWPGIKELVYVKVPQGMKWDRQQGKLVPDVKAEDKK